MHSSLVSSRSVAVARSSASNRTARRSVISYSTGWADPAQQRAEKAMFGEDLGARDATAAEIESNFSDKVIGNWDTEHVIKAPDSIRQHLGLSAHTCSPSPTKLDEREVELMRQQVPGWRMTTADGVQAIRYEWTLKDAAACEEAVKRITAVAEKDNKMPEISNVGSLLVAICTTSSVGGLSKNDFIIASKLNDLDFADLAPAKKAKFWV